MKNGLGKILFIYVFLHVHASLFSQIENTKERQFFNHLYNFQFSEADSLLSTIDSTKETSRFNFLKSHYMRWFYLPIHQQNESILSSYNQYLEATDEIDVDGQVNHLFINSALLKAEFNYNQGNYYKAFQNGAKVYELVKDNLETEPEQIELKFLASLYHYYYQYYKTENPVFGAMMWLFKEGEKEEGLRWLEEVAQDSSILRTEALVYLTHIYLRLENKPYKAVDFAIQLSKRHPNNLKFHELMIESILASNITSDFVQGLIQELKKSEKTYFRKYGICYDAIFTAKFGALDKTEKILKLLDALAYIESNGGGDHLSSLLYFNLFELAGDAEYLEQKIKLEQYKYLLTGYSQEYSN